MLSDRLIRASQIGCMILVLGFIYLPIISLIAFSFNANRFPSLPWTGFSTHWYQEIFSDPTISEAFLLSIMIALATAVTSTLLGFLGAYTDYRWRFPGKNVYLAVIILPPTIPYIVLGLAMLNFLKEIGLAASALGIFISHTILCIPFALAVFRMRLADMPSELEPAAWNLGCGQLRTVVKIVVPHCLPAIAAALMITTAISFDEFVIAWFVSGVNVTLPVRILALLQGQVSASINALGSVVFAISLVLIISALTTIMWHRK
jgi:spermidine/putrescine transport system permease protein